MKNAGATHITATEFARSLSDVLNRVKYRGELFLIDRGNETVALLAPAPGSLGITPQELEARAGDLVMPDPDFARDLEEVRRAQMPAPENPWA